MTGAVRDEREPDKGLRIVAGDPDLRVERQALPAAIRRLLDVVYRERDPTERVEDLGRRPRVAAFRDLERGRLPPLSCREVPFLVGEDREVVGVADRPRGSPSVRRIASASR